MNQIMPIGNGLVIAIENPMPLERYEAFMEQWKERFPGVPVFLANEAQIVLRDDQTILFEFTGLDITPTFVAEFQRWWEEVSTPAHTEGQGVAQAGTMVEPTGRPPGQ